MMDDDIELDALPQSESDPRIQETVAYATTGVELVLNAEFLLDCWVTAALLRDSYMAFLYRRNQMTSEQKFILIGKDSGMNDDDEFGGKQFFGFILNLYRLRAQSGRLSDEVLVEGILAAFSRHFSEEARGELDDCFIPLMRAREIVVCALSYAEGWLSTVEDQGLTRIAEDPLGDYPDWDIWEEEYSPVTFIDG